MERIPLRAEEGRREARGWSVRRNVNAGLTTPVAPLRWLRGMLLMAQPPLLCEEGNRHTPCIFGQNYRRPRYNKYFFGGLMKANIHPNYVEAIVRCACGETFKTRSTKAEIHLEICSKCHPFFTGKQKLVDTAGRVERFQRKYKKTS